MNTLPERIDADRIHAGSCAATPFIHAQRFADGWNACIDFIESVHQPAVAELIEATSAYVSGEYHDAETEFSVDYTARRQRERARLRDAIARLEVRRG